MPARISRQFLTDEALDRAKKMLTAQVTALGPLIHRYSDNAEVANELSRDEDALSHLLGILLYEQRMRRIEDRGTAEYAAAEVEDPAEGREEKP